MISVSTFFRENFGPFHLFYFIFYFCDLIQRALFFGHQVTFHYFDNTVAGKKFEK